MIVSTKTARSTDIFDEYSDEKAPSPAKNTSHFVRTDQNFRILLANQTLFSLEM